MASSRTLPIHETDHSPNDREATEFDLIMMAFTRGQGAPVLTRNVLIKGGLEKWDAEDLEPVYARALCRLNLEKRFGVFVKHIGGGAGWGLFVGPQKTD